MVISDFLSNNWFYLQSPIAVVLFKDFIRTAQDADDLEAQVCRTSVKEKKQLYYFLKLLDFSAHILKSRSNAPPY